MVQLVHKSANDKCGLLFSAHIFLDGFPSEELVVGLCEGNGQAFHLASNFGGEVASGFWDWKGQEFQLVGMIWLSTNSLVVDT